jgi:hypothetical protein
MPIHDWSRVDSGIFHHLHQRWIAAISDALNDGILPDDYYALAEQFAGGYLPDVLTLGHPSESSGTSGHLPGNGCGSNGKSVALAPPPARFAGETDMQFYRAKHKHIAVRHVSGDEVVAVLEIVSPGNKAARNPFKKLIEKAAELLDHDIHLLIVDILPRGRRDPQGFHAALWQEITGQEYHQPDNKPFTLAAYEASLAVRAYVEHAAVGETLPDMPMFLEPGGHVLVPLEATYRTAFTAVPRRWRTELE